MHIAFYVNGHGFGHGVRSLDVINGITQARQDLRISLVCSLPESFLRSGISKQERVTIYSRELDGGLVQKDALHADLAQSAAMLKKTLDSWDNEVADQVQWLKKHKVDLVMSDIAAIPFEAAATVGIPSIGLANFGWDLIYQEMVASDSVWQEGAERYRRAYGKCGVLVEYPWATDLSAFPQRVSGGLVAPQHRSRRAELCRALGVEESLHIGLFAFTSLEDAPRVEQNEGVCLFTMPPLALHDRGFLQIPTPWSFRDALASSDFVVGKPGFGLFSDCATNDIPIIAIERDHFAEAEVLMRGIGKNLRGVRCGLDAVGGAEFDDWVENCISQRASHPLASNCGIAAVLKQI